MFEENATFSTSSHIIYSNAMFAVWRGGCQIPIKLAIGSLRLRFIWCNCYLVFVLFVCLLVYVCVCLFKQVFCQRNKRSSLKEIS